MTIQKQINKLSFFCDSYPCPPEEEVINVEDAMKLIRKVVEADRKQIWEKFNMRDTTYYELVDIINVQLLPLPEIGE